MFFLNTTRLSFNSEYTDLGVLQNVVPQKILFLIEY